MEDRLNGYRNAMSKNGIEQEDLIKPISFDHINEDVEKALRELMESNAAPDAVFALNNHIAVALLKALKNRSFKAYQKWKLLVLTTLSCLTLPTKSCFGFATH